MTALPLTIVPRIVRRQKYQALAAATAKSRASRQVEITSPCVITISGASTAANAASGAYRNPCDSQPGMGSTFSLLLMAGPSVAAAPVAKPALPVEQQPTQRPVSSVLNARVLLVDDNPVNRQVVRLFMTQLLPQIVEAKNGEEALARLHEQPFDIVLLDVHMPVMDGKEAIKRIRGAREPRSEMPVIALTADAMSDDRERYLALGMTDYVSKPLDQRELTHKIALAMDKRQLLVNAA